MRNRSLDFSNFRSKRIVSLDDATRQSLTENENISTLALQAGHHDFL
ncbi:hypothetical protein [Methylocystis sp. SB2]|nr:hypothetical protein [Methylocystis sp. SB2]ULO23959.1 hypothetical protein LNB28_00635 [Methylocystis sp. SB2]